MKKKMYPLLVLSLTFVLWTSCEKESITTSEVTSTPPSPLELAQRYLNHHDTKIPFAVLEMNHSTHNINGVFIDKETNVRKVDIKNATYLQFGTEHRLSGYFMDQFHERSAEIVGTVDTELLADYVKISKKIAQHDNFSINDQTSTSQLILTFSKLSESENASHGSSGCIDGAGMSSETYYKAVLLKADGFLNYEPSSEQELQLAAWLSGFAEDKNR